MFIKRVFSIHSSMQELFIASKKTQTFKSAKGRRVHLHILNTAQFILLKKQQVNPKMIYSLST